MATKLERELEGLATMSREELVARWQVVFGCLPPVGTRKDLLVYAAGWHIQVRRLGGFSGEVKRLLRHEVQRIKGECRRGRVAAIQTKREDSSVSIVLSNEVGTPFTTASAGATSDGERSPPYPTSPVERRLLVPGARLLRDWNGRAYVVDVIEEGFLYEGVTYRSLSAIARRITGARWSGPRFFGL
ncbi:MAG: DUF2924 domain-containing protein [Rhizobiaceae bacterium]|nr:DUF2924 domain-containing protein [Rhizobiaceae bacterium]